MHEVLQAAHIQPYNGVPTNTTQNGLLLRADIHDLFDRGLIWVTSEFKVAIHPRLRGTEYSKFHGQTLLMPARTQDRPDASKLAKHRRDIAMQPR